MNSRIFSLCCFRLFHRWRICNDFDRPDYTSNSCDVGFRSHLVWGGVGGVGRAGDDYTSDGIKSLCYSGYFKKAAGGCNTWLSPLLRPDVYMYCFTYCISFSSSVAAVINDKVIVSSV